MRRYPPDFELLGPLRTLFRAIPRPLQHIVAPLVLWACWEGWWEAWRAPEPGEPVKAFWVTLILFAATLVAQEYLRPKPKIEGQRPAGLGDFSFPTATEDRVVPLVWGRVRLAGPNVTWYGDLRQEAITKRQKTGLWSKTTVTTGFRYHLGVVMGLCRGPDVTLRRVWIGDTEVFNGTVSTNTSFDINKPDLYGGDEFGAGGVRATCDWFVGSDSQPVSDYLNVAGRQRITTAATPTAPRYVGECYLVVREYGVSAASARGAYLGNSTSIRPWAYEVERYPALIPGQSAGQNMIGADCNIMNVAYEIITNAEWGLGDPAADVDAAAFKAAADVMISENNRFSMVLDRQIETLDLLREIERQIDGFIFRSPNTGKWTVKLARDDYTIGTVPQVNDDNSEVLSYTKGTWEDTTNQIVVKYDKRADDYKGSQALAQDMANMLIQGAGTVLTGRPITAEAKFPGVKDSALAENLAWRELRTVAYPLARAELLLDRSFWDLTPGAVVAWTSEELGFTQLPMRVTSIDFGTLQQNGIKVQLVQDVFKFAAASYGTPPDTGWDPPVVGLVAFPAAEQIAIECPRGILVRDPEYGGDDSVSKILTAARRQGGEVAFRITQRNASGSPSGSFLNSGEVVSFMRIGELQSALAAGTAIPTSTITIVPDPDSQISLEEVFDDSSTLQDLGVDLAHLIRVGEEFMLVRSAANNASNVDLQNVYRGVLDSAQRSHSAGAPVYLIFVGAGLSSATIPNTNNVEVELRMRSASAVFSGSVTTVSFTNAKRTLRPYPVSAIFFNGSSTPFNTPDLEGDGGPGENTFGFDVDWRRRRFNTTDEVAELLADQSVDASTEYQVKVFVDPAGANTLVHTSAWQTGTGPEFINRLSIINEAAAGTPIRVQIETRHDIGAEVDLTSRYTQQVDRTPTSGLTGLFYFGGKLRANDNSNSYTAVATGTFTLRIGAAYSTSNVQVSINGGAYATVIAAGLTSGTFAASSSDTIRVRHTINETPSPQFVALENPSATRVAYGCFTN